MHENKITAENIYDIEGFGYTAVVREGFRTADFTVANDEVLVKAASENLLLASVSSAGEGAELPNSSRIDQLSSPMRRLSKTCSLEYGLL